MVGFKSVVTFSIVSSIDVDAETFNGDFGGVIGFGAVLSSDTTSTGGCATGGFSLLLLSHAASIAFYTLEECTTEIDESVIVVSVFCVL